jgi:hypothetical protein
MAASVFAAMTLPITRINSHWQHKKNAAEVTVTRVTVHEVSYIALDKTSPAPCRSGCSSKTSSP